MRFFCEVLMSQSFIKFKRKVRRQSIAAAALLGLGTGLLALAILTLSFKLAGIDLDPLYYVLCGVGAAVLGVVLYFVFMPSDRRLAKRLDSLYMLDEKVSTMIEYRDDDGVFATLQREDADERLGRAPMNMLKSKRLLSGILTFAISFGFFVGAALIPPKPVAPEDPIDEFDKQWIIASLSELITTVENSYVNEGLRDSVLVDLRSLLSFVEESEYMSEMKTEAVKTVISVSSALNKVNSATAIAAQLQKNSNENVVTLGKELNKLSGSGSKKALETLGNALSILQADDATFIASELDSYLLASGVKVDDELYLMFRSLISAINLGGMNIKLRFESEAKKISNIVILQNVNKSTMDIVVKKLCEIFGITADDITAVDPEADVKIPGTSGREELPDEPDVDEPENEMGSGGLGTGDTVFGSDDVVYDPRTDTYRPYGEILNEYFAKVSEMITDGKTSDEIAEAAEEYFSILFSGSGKE